MDNGERLARERVREKERSIKRRGKRKTVEE